MRELTLGARLPIMDYAQVRGLEQTIHISILRYISRILTL